MRRRRGVSQLKLRRASQERIPVALAPAVIAPIMHCMHMRAEYPRDARRARVANPG
jgi:hypothetical protein